MKRDMYQYFGLNQFDSNPTDGPDFHEMIADTWILKALYYGIKKCGGFKWHESWVLVDGVKYNISINNTEIVGDRDCIGLELKLNELQGKVEQTRADIEVLLEAEKQPDGTYTDVGRGIAIALGLLKHNIGE